MICRRNAGGIAATEVIFDVALGLVWRTTLAGGTTKIGVSQL